MPNPHPPTAARDAQSTTTATALQDTPIPDLVSELHAGRVSAADLPVELRQQCVGHLTHDGYTNTEIAHLMSLSERTVRRDRAAFRKADACAPDRLLGDELLGEYHAYTLGAITRLVRLARAADTPHYARLWAEEAITRMYDRLIQTARRMGYFPAGKARLEQQAATDPAERQRKQAYLKGLMELAREALPGVCQPGAKGGKGKKGRL